jgi:mannose-1-phosphate guanylyltransferase
MQRIDTAFVLGAGLGTRLRPLTLHLPKPLVPVLNRPLVCHAFDRLIAVGVRRFVVNTHHLPAAYAAAFPGAVYRGCPIHFRHEPVLLDTAGGLRNAAHLLDRPFLLFNGDICTDLPLEPVLAAHAGSDALATLALRTTGPIRNVRVEPVAASPDGVRVTDLRGLLDPARAGTHQYTGIAVIEPALLERVPSGDALSLTPVLADAIRDGRTVGGAVVDAGDWFDLGAPAEYLAVHARLCAGRREIAPGAIVEAGAEITGFGVIGSGVTVAAGARLRNVVAWSHGGPLRIGPGALLEDCVVFGAGTFQGVNAGPVVEVRAG